MKSAAELGADVIIPFTAARSVSRIAGDKALAKSRALAKDRPGSGTLLPQQSNNRSIITHTSFANMLSQACGKSY